jgi:Cys-rich protein (TIGR01571 family)
MREKAPAFRHTVENRKDLLVYCGVLLGFTIVLWLIFSILAAFRYKSSAGYVPEVGPALGHSTQLEEELTQWQVEWYGCCTDPFICLWSFCCPCIRWAHTLDLLNFLDYGPAVAIFLMLLIMNCMTSFLLIGIFFTMLLVYYRQKLRKMFGMPRYGTCMGYLEDCMCLCFCMPCVIAQEAQHVHLAAEMGYALPACKRLRAKKGSASPAISSSHNSFQDVRSDLSGSIDVTQTRVIGQLELEDHGTLRENSGSSHESVRETRVVTRLVGGRWQHGRTCRLVQNPTPERLLMQPPVRLGAHGEVRGFISLVQLLSMLHDDLRAYVFLFVEVGCVGHCAASCRTLRLHIWADRAFWHFYVGSGVNDRLAQPAACPAAHLRESFRRWIFHIDGMWTKELREFVDHSQQMSSGVDQAGMLSYARYIASGLMPYDNRSAVAEFAGIVCELLAEYNPRQPDARQEAEALTAQIECMSEVFTKGQIKGVTAAFDSSLGRASSSEEEDVEGQGHEAPAFFVAGGDPGE